MAKRKPAKRKPAVKVVVPHEERTPRSEGPTWVGYTGVLVLWLASMGAVFWFATPRGVVPPEPEPSRPFVTLDDSPAEAINKSDARYLLNKADALEEFAKLAGTFPESGAAAKWFNERTAKARADAYAGPGGFDQYVFGVAGGTENGEDRYDAETLAEGALEMARASRNSAAKILGD